MLRPRTSRLGCALPALALAAIAGCGGARRESAPGAPRELLIEVLPRAARVSLDGRPVGAGSGAVPAPPEGEHVLEVEADGYEPGGQPLPQGELAGVRVAVALRPSGFLAPRALDFDDAQGLAAAAAFLVRAGLDRDAADYAARASALEPRLPEAHRVRGDALARLGDRRDAIAEWTEYLRLEPGAPDAADVSERLARARSDVSVR